ncbi:MAG TPA: DUF3579 domain-containing protein [Gammaproteobacteria bacterium]|nr:DUF3579 domain-containing protein [Gammaproteobacteria bacterium]
MITSWIIEGIMEDGRKFRPSDWVERLSTALASFGPDHRLRYADGVQPCFINGQKCLRVEGSLAEENPAAYQYVRDFAHSNKLRVTEVNDNMN